MDSCDEYQLSTEDQATYSSDLESYMEHLEQVKDRPKTILMEEIRQLTHDSITDIEMLRDALFAKARTRDDFPYKEGYLRKRKETRTPNAPSLQANLSRDCFVLIRACDGEFVEDLSEVVPTKQRRDQSLSASIRNRDTNGTVGIGVLQESLAVLKREIHLIKSTYEQKIEALSLKLEGLLKEKESAKTRALKYKEDLKLLQSDVTDCKTVCETLQKSVTELELKQNEDRTEINSVKTDNKKIRKEGSTTIKYIEDEQQKTNREIEHIKKHVTKVKVDVKEMTEATTDIKNIAKRFDNDQLNGVERVKKTMKLMSDRMTNCTKCYESDLSETRDSIKSCSVSVVGLKKQIDKLKKDIQKKNERNVTRQDTLPPRDKLTDIITEPTVKTSNRFDVLSVEKLGSFTESVPIQEHSTYSQKPGTDRNTDESHPANDTHRTAWSDTVRSKPQKKKRPTGTDSSNDAETTQQSIKVHFPSSVCNPMAKRFVGFQQHHRKKIRRFYVHGINRQISSEAAMRCYLEEANVRVTLLRYFEKQWKNTASAQLNVVAEDANIICDESFWPEGIGMREWQPREVFLNEHRYG
ncbi:uncharacterized protein [Argopecten irradians]|uniref:uncharacterized protein n=1 Tax=Argopecten irradians TaxID=31199 RepID=UPI0037126F6F